MYCEGRFGSRLVNHTMPYIAFEARQASSVVTSKGPYLLRIIFLVGISPAAGEEQGSCLIVGEYSASSPLSTAFARIRKTVRQVRILLGELSADMSIKISMLRGQQDCQAGSDRRGRIIEAALLLHTISGLILCKTNKERCTSWTHVSAT